MNANDSAAPEWKSSLAGSVFNFLCFPEVQDLVTQQASERERGRGETLIFVHEQGAPWDVITLGVYRNWRQYAESETIAVEVSDAAARKAGFANADAVGPFMRSLISTHRDTLGPPVRLDK